MYLKMNKTFILLLCLLVACFSIETLTHRAYSQSHNYGENSPPDLLKDFSALRKRVKSNPRDVPALNSLGIIYARAGKLDEAINLWKLAMSIDPTYVHLYNNLGSALKQQKLYDQARLIFVTGLVYSNSYWIHYNLGLLEREEGNTVKAAEAFQHCLALNPDFQPAQKQLMELGYLVQPTKKVAAIPFSIGNYKPPVEVLSDSYKTTESPDPRRLPAATYGGDKKTAAVPATVEPLTLGDCIRIIKGFNAAPEDKFIALTFDDGPHRTHTPELLEILKKEEAKATFFVVGSRAEAYPDLVTRIHKEGHDVGNHSWDHRSLTKSTPKEALTSIRRTNEFISGITGRPCEIVRPPYGASNRQLKNLFRQEEWHEILWDVDSRDWESKNPESILWRVMKTVYPGSIILMHDIHSHAASVLPTIIRAFKACGYEFITITDMIKRKRQQVLKRAQPLREEDRALLGSSTAAIQ
jgi:peptidoglycan/xylan/chitin deacetylase (PgdA/CDA1 family)